MESTSCCCPGSLPCPGGSRTCPHSVVTKEANRRAIRALPGPGENRHDGQASPSAHELKAHAANSVSPSPTAEAMVHPPRGAGGELSSPSVEVEPRGPRLSAIGS